MASLFAHLFDTLPFAAAAATAMKYGQPADSLQAGDLRASMWYAGKPSTWEEKCDTIDSRPRQDAHVWSWRHEGIDFLDVACRVREQRYRKQLVLERLTWGHQDGHAIRKNIKVGVPGFAQELELQLEERFLHSKWYVHEADLPGGEHPLWPLPVNVDSALVMAFVYVLGKDEIVPYVPPADDLSEPAMRELNTSNSPGWWQRALSGSFMEGGPELLKNASPGVVRANLGQKKEVKATAHKILVVLSFCVTKERNDYDLATMAGVSRLHPHIMIKSSVKLTSIDAAVRLTRPAETTILDGDKGQTSCCNAEAKISSLLFTDSNDLGVETTTLPLWSPLFAYGEADPDTRLHYPLRMVIRDKKGDTKPCPVKRYNEFTGGTIDTLRKLDRQGEFDNLHLSPRLKLEADRISWSEVTLSSDVPLRRERKLSDADKKLLRLDDVVMAPICAHDCFHMHWRWGIIALLPVSQGWGNTPYSPNTAIGAPMVAPNQDVDLTLLGAADVIYRALVRGLDFDKGIPAGEWQVVCHHGAGYVQGIEHEKVFAALKAGFSQVYELLTFYDEHGREISAQQDMAVLYWNLRYRVTYDMTAPSGDQRIFAAVERVSFDPRGVDAARRL